MILKDISYNMQIDSAVPITRQVVIIKMSPEYSQSIKLMLLGQYSFLDWFIDHSDMPERKIFRLCHFSDFNGSGQLSKSSQW